MKLTNNKLEQFLNHLLKLSHFQISFVTILVLTIFPLFCQVIMAYIFGIPEFWELLTIGNILIIGLLISMLMIFIMLIFIKELKNSRSQLSETIMELKEAHRRDVYLSQRLVNNIDVLNQEIANRSKIQKQLHEKSKLLQTYMNLSPDLIYLRDEENCFTWCNNSMALLLGISPDKIIGLKPENIYSKEIVDEILEEDDKVLKYNTTVTQELWLTYPNGHRAFFEIKKMPFYNEQTGERCGFIGFGRDITEHQKNKALLEMENRERMTFISVVSHEVRTALNAIIGLSSMLLDTQLDEQQKEYQETIYSSANMLNIIINDVIEFNRLALGKISIDRKSTSRTTFFANLKNIAQSMVKQKHLTFTIDIDPSCPPYLIVDETRINQILWNIIHNAVKFTQHGGIYLSARYDSKRAILYFSIRDTGIGIPKQELSRIFNMYHRVKNTTHAPGTGIGLFVARAIANAMQGDITVESEEEKGSCFTISLYAPETNNAPDDRQIASIISLHILLVEDIELNIVVAKSTLEKYGHIIDVARSGKEALEYFSPKKYDLILLDIQLPDMTGLDIARTLNERYDKEQLPRLIAFTANAKPNKEEYVKAGIDDIMTKPLSIIKFNSIVNHFWPIHDIKNDDDNDSHVVPAQVLKTLLVEDTDVNITIMKSLLEKMGHSVDIAKTGKDVLQLFKPHVYDVILLDINLPDMSGVDIINTLKVQYSPTELPKIVIITAHIIKDLTLYYKAGASAILEKPISSTNLKKLLQKLWQTKPQLVDHQTQLVNVSNSNVASKTITEDFSHLNVEQLTQYIELVGKETLDDSLNMLKEVVPEYLNKLLHYRKQNNHQQLRDEAHKIKGAVSALGLNHLQQIAQKLQDGNLSNWQDKIDGWITEFQECWQPDILQLEQWLQQV